jgi:hypothetical protein
MSTNMSFSTHLDYCAEFSNTYNTWLSQNFHQSINTNHFAPENSDFDNVIHDIEPYDYLIPTFYYDECFDDEMFNTKPDLDLYTDDEDEFECVE